VKEKVPAKKTRKRGPECSPIAVDDWRTLQTTLWCNYKNIVKRRESNPESAFECAAAGQSDK